MPRALPASKMSLCDGCYHSFSGAGEGMPKALGVCLKETEDVILKTIPIIKKDQERKKQPKNVS